MVAGLKEELMPSGDGQESVGFADTDLPSTMASVRGQNGWRNMRDAIKPDDVTSAGEVLRLSLPKEAP
jgi:hypothetical protein